MAKSTKGYIDPCVDLQKKIETKNYQLSNWQAELEVLLNDPNSDVTKIGIIMNTIDMIRRELVLLKTDLKKNNCAGETEFSQDNQTVISSASVRRKDYR
jgi:hypothetical protein